MRNNLKCIAAMSQNRGIGYHGRLLFHLKGDMAQFRELTLYQCAVYGRDTMLTMPHGRPLEDRDNVVLTHDPDFKAGFAHIAHSKEEVLDYLDHLSGDREVYVCGGQSVYEMLLPYSDTVYLTVVEQDMKADRFFPQLDESWHKDMASESFEDNGLHYHYEIYRRKRN
jgi:dihydrofolate reductase